MAPVITVCGLKGGIGKTATATSLAAWWSDQRKVLLIDADPNGSAMSWHRRGEGALGCETALIQHAPMAMAKPWDLVVVDTAGGRKAEQSTYAEGSSFVVCPCQPAASSIEQVVGLVEILKPTGVPYGVLLTMVDHRRRMDAVRARQVLERVGISVLESQITMLSAWPKAEALGLAVKDARTDGGRLDPGAERAWVEVGALATEIEQLTFKEQ